MNVETSFNICDRVTMGGDRSYIAAIQRIMVSDVRGVITYEVAWFDLSGVFQERWMYEWQLALVK